MSSFHVTFLFLPSFCLNLCSSKYALDLLKSPHTFMIQIHLLVCAQAVSKDSYVQHSTSDGSVLFTSKPRGGADSGGCVEAMWKPENFRRNVCNLWRKSNTCKFGDACRFRHEADDGALGGGRRVVEVEGMGMKMSDLSIDTLDLKAMPRSPRS